MLKIYSENNNPWPIKATLRKHPGNMSLHHKSRRVFDEALTFDVVTGSLQ